MNASTTVVAVCGSLRADSYTRTALQYALRAAERAGAETELLDLGEYDLPVYDPDADDQGDADMLKRKVRDADAVLLGSPVYHGTFSGALKNFHDYCGFDEYEDTVTGLLCVAGGESYASTLDHMRLTVRGVHGWVLPHQVGIRDVSDRFEADPTAVDGRAFASENLRARVENLGRLVVEHAATAPSERIPAACADD